MSDNILVSEDAWGSLLSSRDELLKENVKLKLELEEKEIEMKKMKPMLSIQRKIEIYEMILAPELKDPTSVFNHSVIKGTHQLMEYHEAKWAIILTKISDPRVVRLNGLIASANITSLMFCHTIGRFFTIALGLGGIHVPDLNSYGKQEMVDILESDFHIYDNSTIRCITDILMVM
ncbi:uncharacterized protein LOC135840994 [Planococcus citri]|uniref:uncharacterized protein LOC135840994 n=1 Tax=Planococcus citri TaxID=170843 RepID=UPI0031F7956F